MSDWGVLPQQARTLLRRREWENRRHFRQRLTGERAFPIRLFLKPPAPAQALADMRHLQDLVAQWRQWPDPEQVQWERRQFRHLGAWQLPVALQIDSMQGLIDCLGHDAVALAKHWQRVMGPIQALEPALFPTLTRHLDALEHISQRESELLARLLPQLQAGLGWGHYLRGLPLTGVDTKFVESWQPLISALLDTLHTGAITAAGGLLPWLGCLDTPKSWLLVRPLCPATRERLGGLPLLQLDAGTLSRQPLPADNILIVENRQSSTGTGLGLPPLDNCIAIIGGGRNLTWMRAPWLTGKRIGYWGDIDSWGLTILSEARRYQPQVQSLMMDVDTLQRFAHYQVTESSPSTTRPQALTTREQHLWDYLHNAGSTRLEQERLPPDHVRHCLEAWLQPGPDA